MAGWPGRRLFFERTRVKIDVSASPTWSMALNLEAERRREPVSERTAMMAGGIFGAAAGVVVSYLFFTHRGRELRERVEPAVEGLRHDFARFQETFRKYGDLANQGVRVFQEFSGARAQFPGSTTSH
jgi:gas vesicle protein